MTVFLSIPLEVLIIAKCYSQRPCLSKCTSWQWQTLENIRFWSFQGNRWAVCFIHQHEVANKMDVPGSYNSSIIF